MVKHGGSVSDVEGGEDDEEGDEDADEEGDVGDISATVANDVV